MTKLSEPQRRLRRNLMRRMKETMDRNRGSSVVVDALLEVSQTHHLGVYDRARWSFQEWLRFIDAMQPLLANAQDRHAVDTHSRLTRMRQEINVLRLLGQLDIGDP